ncbi:MAG: hypothetical protein K2Q26_13955 [Bdellovibrionales bacterium]|nr:hypothetical protein [Bdellovibrionales bacterium]
MDFKDIRDQLLERIKEYGQKISENEAAVQLTERYRALSPVMQKVLAGATIVLALYIIYSIPASYVSTSQEYEESFEYNRGLIRGLFRSARQPIINSQKFSGLSASELKSRVEGLMTSALVVESQKGSSYPSKNTLPVALPAAIKQEGMTFEIKKLNLKQVVSLGEQISTMHPNTKLAAVEIQADEADPHYFNVKYAVTSLSLPIKSEIKSAPTKKR